METISQNNTPRKTARYFEAVFPELAQLQETQRNEILQDESLPAVVEPQKDYRYFQYQNFRNGLTFSPKNLEKAREMLRKKQISPVEVRIGYAENGSGEMIGTATASFHTTQSYYPFRCSLTFGRDRLISAYCASWDCNYFPVSNALDPKLCPHLIALLFMTEEYLETHNPGDTTNRNGIHMLNHVLQRRENELLTEPPGEPSELLTLQPFVRLDEKNHLSVSFKVGTNRLFTVRQLEEFADHVQKHEELSFGKDTTLLLGSERFTEESKEWLYYIFSFLEEDRERKERRNLDTKYGTPIKTERSLGGSIPLYGALLDQFYEKIEGEQVEFTLPAENGKKEKRLLLAQEGEIQLQLDLHADSNDETGVFQGVALTGKAPATIDGSNASYYIKGDGFYRVSREATRQLAPLLDAADQGKIDIRIGRNHLADFYHKSLPMIRDMADIVEYDHDLIASYIPPEPVFVSYIDLRDDYIVCRADVLYGNRIHMLTDLLSAGAGGTDALDSYRDRESEQIVLNVILKYLPNWDGELKILFAPRDEEVIYDFLDHGLAELMEYSEVHTTDSFRRLRLQNSGAFDVGVSLENDLLNLKLTSNAFSPEELLEIFRSYHLKRKFTRMKNGDFFKIAENENLEQLSEMMQTLNLPLKEFIAGKTHIPAYRALYLDKMLEETADVYADRDRHFKNLVKEFKTITDADFEIPESLKNTLRKYQQEGYRWLRTLDRYRFGGILADEMGLGKTLQVITVLLAVKEESENLPALPDSDLPTTSIVICPSSLVYNWANEFRKFAPKLNVSVVAGNRTDRERKIHGYRQADVLITSYDLLKRDITLYEGKSFAFEILDEAQYIKNRATAAAKSVKLISARTRFALTGTPIENRLAELWSIFDYLMPGFLYEYGSFQNEFETPIVRNNDDNAAERLRRMSAPFILRRRKRDVLKDLPDKLEEIRYASMEDRQQQLYDAQVLRMRKDIEIQDDSAFTRSKIQILAELMKIRQICCDPSLLFSDYDGSSAKREACMDLIRSAAEGEHKALVFSQFTSMLELLEADLKQEGIAYFKITGATPKEDRLQLVNRFNEDDTPVFLISLKAGGTGLNLTGADIVIHYDPWWNLAVQNQATDRAHRIGQKNIVTVYKLIAKGTIEEKIVEMQESKRQLAEDILNTETAASASISREDLLALLE